MPFTLSHAAAVLPLSRSRLPFSALAVGSMAPDFPYFLPPFLFAQFGHTIMGVFGFCLPAGALALALFHGFLKFPLLDLLPPFLLRRFAHAAHGFRCASARDAALIACALVVGAFTHLFWDAFTHGNGGFVARFSMLRLTLETPLGALPLFKALQHGSSALGALALLFAAYLWWNRAPPCEEKTPRRLTRAVRVLACGVVCFVPILVGAASGFAAMKSPGGEWLIEVFARRFAVAGVAAAFVVAMLWSAWWHWQEPR